MNRRQALSICLTVASVALVLGGLVTGMRFILMLGLLGFVANVWLNFEN